METEPDEVLAYLLGALADGSVYKSEKHYVTRISYYQKSKEYLIHCVEPRITALFNCSGHFYHDKRKDVWFYEVTRKHVFDRFIQVLGSYKEKQGDNRRVPDWIMSGTLAMRLSFVRGFFDAEGFYYIQSAISDYRVRFGQASYGILEDLKHILEEAGFKSSPVLGPYQSRALSKAQPYYELHLHGKAQVIRFHDHIKPCHPAKQRTGIG